MDWLNKLKISSKLTTLIVIGVFFVVLVGTVGAVFINKGNAGMETMYKDRVLPIQWLLTVRVHLNANKANIYDMLTTNNVQEKMRLQENIKVRAEEANDLLEKYGATKLDPYEVENLPKLKQYLAEYRDIRTDVINLAMAGKNSAGLAKFKATDSEFQKIVDSITGLSDYNVKAAEGIDVQNGKDAVFAQTLSILIILIAIGGLSVIGYMISKMITGPIIYAVSNLGEGAANVSSASRQVEAASQQLAEGSSEQAASIQETSATIEESESMVRQNAENTKQASYLAKEAKEGAQKGTQEMHEMMSSMEQLKKSSDEIGKIIKVIDEIAFQTNILSLNAAVEAARAGDAGKGFAVVAEEVRGLAQRCAQAAQDTAVIIESNIQLSEKGVDLSHNVNKSLEGINVQANKVSELLDEISVATQEQAQGISQINVAISQMEQVIQANAQTAQESASASEELSSQAVSVKEIVDTLQVLVEGVDSVQKNTYKALSVGSNHNKKLLSTSAKRTQVVSLNDF